MTSATLGFSADSANAEETGSAAAVAASIATARRRPANGSFMGSLRSYDYCEQRSRWRKLDRFPPGNSASEKARKRLRRPNYANPADICQQSEIGIECRANPSIRPSMLRQWC
jgi:hypothetical protein